MNKETGELEKQNVYLQFDEEKYKRDCALDGYYAICSSEIDIPDGEIIDKYRGLSKIEESFKVIKSQLEGRPVFVWTPEHIEAHFLVCFVSLLIAR
ncbi:MAG: transposase, partial [Anaerolineaceae bacterium]